MLGRGHEILQGDRDSSLVEHMTREMIKLQEEDRFMERALRLAQLGWGTNSPNPLVGAVAVKKGKAVGQGYHRGPGFPHAEREALEQAGRKARGATLYVNLEPCSHWGRQGPCTERIIEAGVRRVVAAMTDPNPLVRGRGIRALRRSGIKVEVGLRKEQAKCLNLAFCKYITTGSPFVTLKEAVSLDGKIATRRGESRWISGKEARDFTSWLRAGVDGVLVGVNTVIKDDPSLTARGKGRDPSRIIVDSRAQTPPRARMLTDKRSPVMIVVSDSASTRRIRKLQMQGAEVICLGSRRPSLRRLMRLLGKRQFTSLLIEGGGEVAAAALGAGIVDRLLVFLAPLIIGGREALTAVEGKGAGRLQDALRLPGLHFQRLGKDLLVGAYLHEGLPGTPLAPEGEVAGGYRGGRSLHRRRDSETRLGRSFGAKRRGTG